MEQVEEEEAMEEEEEEAMKVAEEEEEKGRDCTGEIHGKLFSDAGDIKRQRWQQHRNKRAHAVFFLY